MRGGNRRKSSSHRKVNSAERFRSGFNIFKSISIADTTKFAIHQKKPFAILKTIPAQTGSTNCIYLIFKKVHPMRMSLSTEAVKVKGMLRETSRPHNIFWLLFTRS
jgi:hypothetical protein